MKRPISTTVARILRDPAARLEFNKIVNSGTGGKVTLEGVTYTVKPTLSSRISSLTSAKTKATA